MLWRQRPAAAAAAAALRRRPRATAAAPSAAASTAAATAATSFVPPDARGHFPLQNLPYGVFAPEGGAPRAGVRIGDHVSGAAPPPRPPWR